MFSVTIYLNIRNISIYLNQYTIHQNISVSIHQYRVADCTLPHEGKRVNQLVRKKMTQNIDHKNVKWDIND